MNEPITDAVRGTLDGHIVLTRELAAGNHYPAVDVLASVSRLMPQLVDKAHLALAARVRSWLAAHRSAKDLLEIGAYVTGSNADVDQAVARMPNILGFLRQDAHEVCAWPQMLSTLQAVAR
jgi:flagellar biosynthesis/type III secretory pathway ATPase